MKINKNYRRYLGKDIGLKMDLESKGETRKRAYSQARFLYQTRRYLKLGKASKRLINLGLLGIALSAGTAYGAHKQVIGEIMAVGSVASTLAGIKKGRESDKNLHAAAEGARKGQAGPQI